jgi:radical SAM superfamily enzyme YgiQ (UPF0313 family)
LVLMLTLINTNRMVPIIGPVGLDYIAGAAARAGINTEVVDLCLAHDPSGMLWDYFDTHNPTLVGLSFRNVDDCFWPSAEWFVPELAETVRELRGMTDAAIVIGGVGFSIFAPRIVEHTGADFGIHGDGEEATVCLFRELQGSRRFDRVAGLIWRSDRAIHCNSPAWPAPLSLPTGRDAIDNRTYFEQGGQCGLETKRGCNRSCLYCADPLAKGTTPRLREPSEVADEAESLLAQGAEVLHLCDSEFNIPRSHAYAVCEQFCRRSLAERLRWYTYMAVTPFDADLAAIMSRAGCIGINFTGDSASGLMLATYRQQHLREDLASAVRLCRPNNIRVMIDLLFGGPGETPDTAAETIDFIKQIEPDCAGAPLGVRIYPGTGMAEAVDREGPLDTNRNIHRKYEGKVDFFKPTFYISDRLGEAPAMLIRDLIDGDKRFFEPTPDAVAEVAESKDHNYSDNTELVEAIRGGQRGAYWDILRKMRGA